MLRGHGLMFATAKFMYTVLNQGRMKTVICHLLQSFVVIAFLPKCTRKTGYGKWCWEQSKLLSWTNGLRKGQDPQGHVQLSCLGCYSSTLYATFKFKIKERGHISQVQLKRYYLERTWLTFRIITFIRRLYRSKGVNIHSSHFIWQPPHESFLTLHSLWR